jgi:hypothetical protein
VPIPRPLGARHQLALCGKCPPALTEWWSCFVELVWLEEGFFDFFFAWLLVDFFDFFVVPVGAAPVSGAIVGAPPGEAVWAYESIGSTAAATNVSKANPEISAFIRELLN